MDNLTEMKNDIEKLEKIHHIEIFRIIKNNNITYNENRNGIFLNLSCLSPEIIQKIKSYISYVKTQQEQLRKVETQKDSVRNTFFNGNKDNNVYISNEL